MPTVELCSGPRVTRAGRGREALGTLLLLIKPRDGSLHAALHLQVCLLSTCTRCVVPPTRVGRLVCKEHCAVAVLPSWRNIVLTIDRDAHEPAPGRPDRLTEPRQPPPNDSVVAPFSAMGCTKFWRGATHRNTPRFGQNIAANSGVTTAGVARCGKMWNRLVHYSVGHFQHSGVSSLGSSVLGARAGATHSGHRISRPAAVPLCSVLEF